jgi:putative aldouronate transport system permease protein
MGTPKYYQHLYVWSGIWQSFGWSSIIYMAALSSVDTELHEAAMIDGANRTQRIWHIDIPAIMPVMMILLVLASAGIMSVGFEKSYLMQNDLNITVSEVISTYTYKTGMGSRMFSYSTAIGLFNNVVNFIMLVIVNYAAGRLSETSLW